MEECFFDIVAFEKNKPKKLQELKNIVDVLHIN
jgi:hypothetical protein